MGLGIQSRARTAALLGVLVLGAMLTLLAQAAVGSAEAEAVFAESSQGRAPQEGKALREPDGFSRTKAPTRYSPGPIEPLVDHQAAAEWVDRVLAMQAQQEESPFAAVDLCVAEEMSRTNTPGASIAIALDGVITYTKGYGVRHAEEGGAVDPGTMFRFGSTLKMMTAAAVMQQVEKGRVDVHAPITTYVPYFELADPWNAVTLTTHHLLTHSSGFPDRTFTLDDDEDLDRWAGNQGDVWLNAPPGTFWNYSNPNFALAGLVVQEASGIPYPDYVRSRVWRPAGMALTTLDAKAVEEYGNFAYGHGRGVGEEPIPPSDYGDPDSWVAPAGLGFSTPTELVTWTLQLMAAGGEVLQPESAAAMQSPQQPLGTVPYQSYGYGIFVEPFVDVADPTQQVTVLYHPGNAPGWSSSLYWVPERGFAVSILANTVVSLNGSAICALEKLAGVRPMQPTGHTTEPQTWEKYTGTYSMVDVLGVPWTGRLTLEGDQLSYADTDLWALGTEATLSQLAFDMFLFSVDEGAVDVTFFKDRPASEEPGEWRWMRSRSVVGERIGHLTDSITVTGRGCSTMEFEPTIDIPDLKSRTYGPVLPDIRHDVPIAQDSFRRPDTASFKVDIRPRSSVGLFVASIDGEPDDDLDLYVLFDADLDGEFYYPYEVLWPNEHTVNPTSQEAIILPGNQPAGHYQVWVHGYDVQGDDSTFDFRLLAASGRDLILSEAPAAVRAGESYEMELCATGLARAPGPQVGLVEFLYGYPPRRVNVMVDWMSLPGADLYLPLTMQRFAWSAGGN